MQTIKSNRLKEEYIKIIHSTGLTLLLCPMQGFSSAYALFGTKYGSVDTCFKTKDDPDFVKVPEGIAHFLEHKLFESEDGDAFSRYAKTGASANAYTSFDKTSYLFSCTENFEESLKILLDFVTNPYFTKETVEKEQGIIGQEIGMYDDNAQWRVLFNLLGALYHNHPIKIDIAGTVQSIAKIDDKLLYRCYNAFYNLNNMVLSIAGNFDVNTVLKCCEKILKPSPDIKLEVKQPHEPSAIVQKRCEQFLPVALPLFHIGFKGVPDASQAQMIYHQIRDDILLDIIAGEASVLYGKMYNDGLVNQSFGMESLASRDYCINLFAGESKDPEKVYSLITQEINNLKLKGIDKESFRRSQKAIYGRYISMYSSPHAMASVMQTAHFAQIEAYEILDVIANTTQSSLNDRLITAFDIEKSALSVVKNKS